MKIYNSVTNFKAVKRIVHWRYYITEDSIVVGEEIKRATTENELLQQQYISVQMLTTLCPQTHIT